jgi:hypothetical protein
MNVMSLGSRRDHAIDVKFLGSRRDQKYPLLNVSLEHQKLPRENALLEPSAFPDLVERNQPKKNGPLVTVPPYCKMYQPHHQTENVFLWTVKPSLQPNFWKGGFPLFRRRKTKESLGDPLTIPQ